MGIMDGRLALCGSAGPVAVVVRVRPLLANVAAKVVISRMMPRPATGNACKKVGAILAHYPIVQS